MAKKPINKEEPGTTTEPGALSPDQQTAQDWLSGKSDKPKRGGKKVAKAAAKKKGPKAEGSKSDTIRQYKKDHPTATTTEIAEATKTNYNLVYQALAKKKKKKAHRGSATGGNGAPAKRSHDASNGHATAFVHSAFNLGLDTAIALLQKVKKAVE
jgi:hypothetical protein